MKDRKLKIICWWSGGITSAVACNLAIDIFGKENCRVIMIDTRNEDPDTYRFKKDCEKWYGLPITRIGAFENTENEPDYDFVDIGANYKTIEDVWSRYLMLNAATGAICSTDLKRRVREKWQKSNEFDHQIFGFEFDKKEVNRALSLFANYPKSKPIFPLLMMAYDKMKCIEIVESAGIKVPDSYLLGLKNNNCLGTGCVQGGIGYWQLMKTIRPENFERMADREHRLTNLKGKPVTMLKDQSKVAKESGNELVFLRKHPDYPNLKSIDDMPTCKVEPLFECNGFCGVNDTIQRNPTEMQINYVLEL